MKFPRFPRAARAGKAGAGLVICIIGYGVAMVGVWEIYPPAGKIAIGLGVIFCGWLADSLGGEDGTSKTSS